MLSNVAEHLVALEVVDVAQHRMLGGLRSHALEVLGWERADHLAAIWSHDATGDLERSGFGVESHAHITRGIEGANVGGRERRLDGVKHLLEWDANLRAERRQGVRGAFGRRLRLRPRACPRQGHPTQCELLQALFHARPARIRRCPPSRRRPAVPRSRFRKVRSGSGC